ncbi:hypothetical protein JCM8202_003599 [Rhodotorula sphaerocarpa]
MDAPSAVATAAEAAPTQSSEEAAASGSQLPETAGPSAPLAGGPLEATADTDNEAKPAVKDFDEAAAGTAGGGPGTTRQDGAQTSSPAQGKTWSSPPRWPPVVPITNRRSPVATVASSQASCASGPASATTAPPAGGLPPSSATTDLFGASAHQPSSPKCITKANTTSSPTQQQHSPTLKLPATVVTWGNLPRPHATAASTGSCAPFSGLNGGATVAGQKTAAQAGGAGAVAGAATSVGKGEGRGASASGAEFAHHAGGEDSGADADAEGEEDDGAPTSLPAAASTATAAQPISAASTSAPALAQSLPYAQSSPYGTFSASLHLQSTSKQFLAASEPFMPFAPIPRATAPTSPGPSGQKQQHKRQRRSLSMSESGSPESFLSTSPSVTSALDSESPSSSRSGGRRSLPPTWRRSISGHSPTATAGRSALAVAGTGAAQRPKASPAFTIEIALYSASSSKGAAPSASTSSTCLYPQPPTASGSGFGAPPQAEYSRAEKAVARSGSADGVGSSPPKRRRVESAAKGSSSAPGESVRRGSGRTAKQAGGVVVAAADSDLEEAKQGKGTRRKGKRRVVSSMSGSDLSGMEVDGSEERDAGRGHSSDSSLTPLEDALMLSAIRVSSSEYEGSGSSSSKRAASKRAQPRRASPAAEVAAWYPSRRTASAVAAAAAAHPRAGHASSTTATRGPGAASGPNRTQRKSLNQVSYREPSEDDLLDELESDQEEDAEEGREASDGRKNGRTATKKAAASRASTSRLNRKSGSIEDVEMAFGDSASTGAAQRKAPAHGGRVAVSTRSIGTQTDESLLWAALEALQRRNAPAPSAEAGPSRPQRETSSTGTANAPSPAAPKATARKRARPENTGALGDASKSVKGTATGSQLYTAAGKEGYVTQSKNCVTLVPTFGAAKPSRCYGCTAKRSGFTCCFIGIRSFPLDARGHLLPQATFLSYTGVDEEPEYCTDFNVPFTMVEAQYIRTACADALLPTLEREVSHADLPGSVRFRRQLGFTYTCDGCAASFLCGSWMCTKCAREYCLDCRVVLDTLPLDDICKHPSNRPLPRSFSGGIAGLNPHTVDKLTRCVGEKRHGTTGLIPIVRMDVAELRRLVKEMTVWRQTHHMPKPVELSAEWIAAKRFQPSEKENSLAYLRLPGRLMPPVLDEDKPIAKVPKGPPFTQPISPQPEDVVLPEGLEELEKVDLPDLLRTFAQQLPSALASTHQSQSQVGASSSATTSEQVPSPSSKKPEDLSQHDLFRAIWSLGEPIVVDLAPEHYPSLPWTPEFFSERFGDEVCRIGSNRVKRTLKDGSVVDCERLSTVGQFFETFGKARDHADIEKIKDWPSAKDFRVEYPQLWEDFMAILPAGSVTRRDGVLDIAAHQPAAANPPDLGPKGYFSQTSDDRPGGTGSTKLHTVNIMLWASDSPDGSPGAAAWDLYRAEDADLIRDFLYEKIAEQEHLRDAAEARLHHDDPIHAQRFYLDSALRKALYEAKGVKSFRVLQRPGQAVFIPAGCAHQVCNLADCIKVATDFVSIENVARCWKVTDQFRDQTKDKVLWRSDVLQLKTMLLWAWKSAERFDSPGGAYGGSTRTGL